MGLPAIARNAHQESDGSELYWILLCLLINVLLAVSLGPSVDAEEEDEQARGIVSSEIPFFSIDGGGAIASSGGQFELAGTVGQPEAGGIMSGGEFELTTGFWAILPVLEGLIFEDGFESGDTFRWTFVMPN